VINNRDNDFNKNRVEQKGNTFSVADISVTSSDESGEDEDNEYGDEYSTLDRVNEICNDIDLFAAISDEELNVYKDEPVQYTFEEMIEPRVSLLMDIIHANGLNAILLFEFDYDFCIEKNSQIKMPENFKEINDRSNCEMLWSAININGKTAKPVMIYCAEMLRNFRGKVHFQWMEKIASSYKSRRKKQPPKVTKKIRDKTRKMTNLIAHICKYFEIPCCLCVRTAALASNRQTITSHGSGVSVRSPAIQFIRCAIGCKDVNALRQLLRDTGVRDDDPGMQFLSRYVVGAN